ncbi:MAG: hypothetical protein HC915_17685 [Anaerolineae bacterium]|nr:hypothetical protein [Anaerolineae bacterium]
MASVLFPLMVLGLFPRAARANPFFVLSGITFLAAAFFFYFVGESGQRLGSGNFTWGAGVALMVWYVAGVLVLLRRNLPTFFGYSWADRVRSLVVYTVLLLHVISGLAWLPLAGARAWW